MKKYIVLSDTHGNRKDVESLLYTVEHDGVFFAGDGVDDFEHYYRDIYMVRGNCDFFSDLNTVIIKEICGTKVLITHGHLYGAKSGMGGLITLAKANDIKLVIFGHTHMSYYEIIDGITFVNPGTFKKSIFNKSTYSIIDFDDNGFYINMREF